MGSLLASIVLPSMPFGSGGQFVTWETAAGIALPESFWISFDETGPGAPDTFWLSGTSEGLFGDIAPGYSAQGLLFLDPSAPPYPYGYWGRGTYGGRYLFFPPGDAINANMAVGLSGYFVPQPAAIGVLALGGLVALRRRRRLSA